MQRAAAASRDGPAARLVGDRGYLIFTATNPRLSERVTIAEGSKGFLEQFFWQVNLHRCWERELDGYSSMVSM